MRGEYRSEVVDTARGIFDSIESDVGNIADSLRDAIHDSADVDVDSITSAIKELEQLAARLR